MASIAEIVIGSTRKNLRVTVTDPANGNAVVNITGGTVRLEGTSEDLPGKTLDVAGTIFDGPNGVAQWAGIGDPAVYISTGDMGSRDRATFNFRVKFTDSSGKVDFGPLFAMDWVLPPF